MPISTKRYVDITSGINNVQTLTEKELIARIFTTNALIDKNVIKEFDLDGVRNFFGATSDEYKVASRYFGFINKYVNRPKKISFGKIFQTEKETTVTSTAAPTLEAIKEGQGDREILIAFNGEGYVTSESFNVSANAINNATTLAELAANITEEIHETNNDPINKSSLYYRNGQFVFTAGTAGAITVTLGSTLGTLLGLTEATGAVETAGSISYDYVEIFKNSYQLNNNFATYAFLSTPTTNDIKDVGEYVETTYPSEFMLVVPVTTDNAAAFQEATKDIDGVSLELCGTTEDTGKFNWVIPMAITATTDYTRENGTQNYMYNQFDDAAVMVDTDEDANIYDELKVNYYGRTQAAGQKLAFYQRGVLQGDYQDQNIFVNEIWLKDALTTTYLNYMLLTPNWYANSKGKAIGQALAQNVISRAKLNGTITTEKELTAEDKAYILNITNDDEAWRQIYQEGFYLMTSITKEVTNGQTTYKFNYTLVYSKGDSIKKVEGKDILI